MSVRYVINLATGCWEWQGAKTSTGYGAISVKGRTTPAHRVFYEKAHGALDPKLHLHHRCEVRACVNPDHLEPLSAVAHRREHASLTADLAHEIRESTEPSDVIAERLGITRARVAFIRAGKTWADEDTVLHPRSYYRSVRSERAAERQAVIGKKLEELWGRGLTTEDIAEAMGWTLGNASLNVHRARARGFHLPYRRCDGRMFDHCQREAA